MRHPCLSNTSCLMDLEKNEWLTAYMTGTEYKNTSCWPFILSYLYDFTLGDMNKGLSTPHRVPTIDQRYNVTSKTLWNNELIGVLKGHEWRILTWEWVNLRQLCHQTAPPTHTHRHGGRLLDVSFSVCRQFHPGSSSSTVIVCLLLDPRWKA